uniref:Subtilisin-chymotrypsin inhibitor CI-1C n=1 Tax=Aegilops tauschii TaxID=37682 RepID=M8AXG1_AEGTA
MGRSEPVDAGGGGDGTGKTSWPEVVGWSVERAAAQINGDRPDVSVTLIYSGPQWPPGHNPWRVVVLSNEAGVVVKTPIIG